MEKDKVCSNNQQEQPTVENPQKCEFKLWGINKDHCVSECHEGEFRDKYGGELCTKKSCVDICGKCVNTKYCPWLIKKTDERPSSVPSTPKNLVAISADRSAILMWSKPSENGSEILKYKIIFYKKNAPNEGVSVENVEPGTSNDIKFNLRGLDNNITYSIGV